VPKSAEEIETKVRGLRRNLLLFCKQQWPPPPVTDEAFEGDFWEAVVRACMGEEPFADGTDPALIEYSPEETHLAILLVQAGLALHPVEGESKIRLVRSSFCCLLLVMSNFCSTGA